MTEIVNNNRLKLILTEYGLERIAQVCSEGSTDTLNITKIRIGSGKDYEYYEPSKEQSQYPKPYGLYGDLGYEFYVLDKDLLEDKMTVSFHTVISENFGGFDIREVGLYETKDGEDHLFAIGTQQPFVKPTMDDNYLISIDYYILLRIANVAEFYDKIVLDPENALITAYDLEDVMRTITFTQGNLITQIGNNSRIIGYNRATQLYDKIQANQESFSYITTYKNYASLLDYINENKFIGYWVFNYSRRKDTGASIVDISTKGNYLSTNDSLTSYKRDYDGFMSTLEFPSPNYFYLSPEVNTSLLNDSKTADNPFTVIFAVDPLHLNTKRTIIAKSNYAVGSHTFEINELPNRSLEVKLFSDAENYITFTSDNGVIPESSGHSVVLLYDNILKNFTAYICGKKCFFNKVVTGTYNHMNENASILYAFTCTPSAVIYADSNEHPTKILNEDGTPYEPYEGSAWTIYGDELLYHLKTAVPLPPNAHTDPLYAWTYGGNTIYTKTETIESLDTPLYHEDYTICEDENEFKVIAAGSSNFIIICNNDPSDIANRDSSKDKDSEELYAWRYFDDTQIVWTNRIYNPTVLYNSEGNIYKGTDWRIVGDQVLYLGIPGEYDEERNMEAAIVGITSYVIGTDGNPTQNIDSKVGLLSIIKDKLTDEQAYSISLNLEGTMGKNPCIDKK